MSSLNLATKPAGAGADSFPKWVLLCAGGIIAFSLISVGLVRITGNGPDQRAAAPTVQRSLLFQDQKDGGVLVADGRNLWFFDRDLEQVTVKPIDAALSQTPAMLLSGTARVRDAFDVSAASRSDGLDWVKVVPHQKDADFRVARFGFLGTDLRRMVLEDKLGQKATLSFESSQRNRPVDPAQVNFTAPPGVDVIGTPLK